MPPRGSATKSLSPAPLGFGERSLTCGRCGNISVVVGAALQQLQKDEVGYRGHPERHAPQGTREDHSIG